ncbi:MAG TPA: peptidylprolyl isomerase [Ktedonobacterales bacterium]|nr:peptidylprolyl isomerase [Ktedonobacterales bacterium]
MIRLLSRTPRRRLPLALAALLCMFVLAGCGVSASSGPLVAARVNGDGISLSDYQAMLTWDEASAALPSASQAAISTAWQTPDGRTGLTQTQHTALDFLVNLQLVRQQLHTQHISVTAASLASVHGQLQSAIKDAIARNDPALNAALTKLTPHVQDLLVEQQADQQALIAHIQVPTIHVRVILVASQNKASDLLGQIQSGTDFALLAKQDSKDLQTAQAGGEYGTVYIGQFGSEFDARVFAKTPDKYFILPINGEYAIFEVTKPANAPLSALNNAQNEQTVFDAWLLNDVRAHASIQTDVAIG